MTLLSNGDALYGGNMSFSFTMGKEIVKNPTPTRVTYQGTTTIVFWSDDTKTVVRCSKLDEYDRETAVAFAIAHKLFGSKNKFKKFVDAGYEAMSVDVEIIREHVKAEKAKRKHTSVDDFPF